MSININGNAFSEVPNGKYIIVNGIVFVDEKLLKNPIKIASGLPDRNSDTTIKEFEGFSYKKTGIISSKTENSSVLNIHGNPKTKIIFNWIEYQLISDKKPDKSFVEKPVNMDFSKSILAKVRNSQSAPVVEKVLTAPVVEKVLTAPVVEEVLTAPVVEEVLTAPFVEEVLTAPFVEEVLTAPVVEEVLTAPFVEEVLTAPVVKTSSARSSPLGRKSWADDSSSSDEEEDDSPK